MLRQFVVQLAVLLCAASATSAADFRNTDWGMTKSEVRASESGGDFLDERENLLAYSVVLDSKKCQLFYFFYAEGIPSVRSVLRGAQYSYVDSDFGSNDEDQVAVYEAFCAKLTEKYGKPITSAETWHDNLFPQDKRSGPAIRAIAIGCGSLSLESIWKTAATKITCKIWGGAKADMGRIHVDIIYEDFAFLATLPTESLKDF